jgi:signal transduction histidine kinase
VILGGIEFLENKLTRSERQVKTAIHKIKDATVRANTIIQNMLKFARPSDLKTEKAKIKDLINEALSLLEYGTPHKNIEIETHYTQKNMSIEADKNQMQQVFFNLMTNAVDAMPRGGKIIIKAYEMQEPARDPESRLCAIEIKDNGEGIPETHLKKLFEPFFTTKRDKKGTGLGLPMSKMIVHNHKGNLEIDSKPGEGTTAKIILPQA